MFCFSRLYSRPIAHSVCCGRFELSGIEPVLPVADWSPYVVDEDLQQLSDDWFGFLAGDEKEITMEWRWKNGNAVQG